MNVRSISRVAFLLLSVALAGNAAGKAARPRAPKTKLALKKVFPTDPTKPANSAKWMHAPFAQSECSLCHKSADPQKPGPVKTSTNKQCLACHEPIRKWLKENSVAHEPVAKNCSYCHNPHDGSNRELLYQLPPALCTACHVRQKEEMLLPVKHDAVVRQKACGNCHDTHAAANKKLLVAPSGAVCAGCHGKDGVKDGQGRALTNLTALRRERTVLHEPFAKNQCPACHRPHGGKNPRLLVAAYSGELYAPFEAESYALCFGCHKAQAIREEKTTTLTKFRDGEKNLHYVHVVKLQPGRSCRLCHDDHASAQGHLIRASVPYGSSGWSLPLTYETAPTGGSCAKTCHDRRSYSYQAADAVKE